MARTLRNSNKPLDDESKDLDLLFQELAQQSQPQQKPQTSEFDAIQQEIEQLPKIESNLEAQLSEPAKPVSSFVVKVNDPITVVRRSKKEEPTDAGASWFNMSKPEMTPELKRDLLILKNRSVLDPKRHYKKDKWEIPKYFQTGTIIEGNTEFYSARLAKKNRGKTLAEEILNDDDAQKYFDRKYSEVQKVAKSGGKQFYDRLKSKRRGY